MMVGGNIKGHTGTLTTAMVLETGKGNFEIAIALSILLMALVFGINWTLTPIQQRRPAGAAADQHARLSTLIGTRGVGTIASGTIIPCRRTRMRSLARVLGLVARVLVGATV